MTTFLVRGLPVTQGSKKVIPLPNGKIVLVEAAGDRLKQWRHAINDEARSHWIGPPATGPVIVAAVFTVVRPKSAPKRTRTWPTGARSGDLDKLARAVLDALTGVTFVDDAQVVDLHCRKDFGDTPGVLITVAPLCEQVVA